MQTYFQLLPKTLSLAFDCSSGRIPFEERQTIGEFRPELEREDKKPVFLLDFVPNAPQTTTDDRICCICLELLRRSEEGQYKLCKQKAHAVCAWMWHMRCQQKGSHFFKCPYCRGDLPSTDWFECPKKRMNENAQALALAAYPHNRAPRSDEPDFVWRMMMYTQFGDYN